MAVNPTAQKILTVAQHNVQTKGFNGFSYRDLAVEIGIKTSSIHYHFPTKDDLALALVEAYHNAFEAELTKIRVESGNGRSQLKKYIQLFERNLAVDNKFCLCGMLASEINSLSERVKQAIQSFFSANELWLSELIAKGQADGSLNQAVTPDLAAAQLLATLEGAMLIARSAEAANNLARFQQIVWKTVESLY
ncbi:MAG: TetR/AcrR family transcriptional regulator [Cyanobacteria bacterium J06607_15]